MIGGMSVGMRSGYHDGIGLMSGGGHICSSRHNRLIVCARRRDPRLRHRCLCYHPQSLRSSPSKDVERIVFWEMLIWEGRWE